MTGGCCDCIFPWFTIPDGFYATVAMFGKQMDYTEPETCVELYDFVFFVSTVTLDRSRTVHLTIFFSFPSSFLLPSFFTSFFVVYFLYRGKKTPIWPSGCHMKKYGCFSGVRELVTKQTLVFDTPVEKV